MESRKDRRAAKIGKLGGKATLSKYGPDHFRKLAKKMHAKRRKMLRLTEKTGELH